MRKEPVWMEEIREQMRKSRFYGQADKERERYEKKYRKILGTLTPSQAKAIRKYVEQVEKCEYHHVRIAYLQGMEDEKVHQKARTDRFYDFVMRLDVMDAVVYGKIKDLCQYSPEFQAKCDAFMELDKQYRLLKQSLPEEDRALLNAYWNANARLHNMLYYFTAGFPKGYIPENF